MGLLTSVGRRESNAQEQQQNPTGAQANLVADAVPLGEEDEVDPIVGEGEEQAARKSKCK